MAQSDELVEGTRRTLIVGPNHVVCEYAKKHLDVVPVDAKPVSTYQELVGHGPNTEIFIIVGHPVHYEDDVIRQITMYKALYNNVRMVKS